MENKVASSTTKKKPTLYVARIDAHIWICMALICAFGTIMVYSASSFSCGIDPKYGYDSLFFAKREDMFAVVGLVLMLIIQRIPYRFLRKMTVLAYIVGLGMIFLLLTPLGIEANHAVRWIGRGIVRFQAAEVVKISLIICLAGIINRYRNHISWETMVWMWGLGGFMAVLLWQISDDLSSAVVLLGITFGMTLIFTRMVWLHVSMLGGVVGLAWVAYHYMATHLPSAEALEKMSFRVGRLAAWVDPDVYSSDQGYQTLQSLYAIGNGGLFGRGLGNGIQKLTKIPEAQNDMIFAIICEELGLIGACVLIGLYICLIYHLINIVMESDDIFGSALVVGVVMHISVQVLLNIAVCLNVIPNTGISLPFVSYGGTSILLLLMEIGMALSVFWNNAKNKEKLSLGLIVEKTKVRKNKRRARKNRKQMEREARIRAQERMRREQASYDRYDDRSYGSRDSRYDDRGSRGVTADARRYNNSRTSAGGRGGYVSDSRYSSQTSTGSRDRYSSSRTSDSRTGSYHSTDRPGSASSSRRRSSQSTSRSNSTPDRRYARPVYSEKDKRR